MLRKIPILLNIYRKQIFSCMCCNGLFLIVEVPVVVAVSTASSHNSNITTGERTSLTRKKLFHFSNNIIMEFLNYKRVTWLVFLKVKNLDWSSLTDQNYFTAGLNTAVVIYNLHINPPKCVRCSHSQSVCLFRCSRRDNSG